MSTHELLQNAVPTASNWIALIAFILTLVLTALITWVEVMNALYKRRAWEAYSADRRLGNARLPLPRGGVIASPTTLCAKGAFVIGVASMIFFNVFAWNLKSGSEGTKIAAQIEERYTLESTAILSPMVVQGREFTTSGGEVVRLDVTGTQVGFKNSEGDRLNLDQHERLTKEEVLDYVQEHTKISNPVIAGITGEMMMPSLSSLEGHISDTMLTVKGTIDGQVVTINIATEDGELMSALAEESGIGFSPEEVFL